MGSEQVINPLLINLVDNNQEYYQQDFSIQKTNFFNLHIDNTFNKLLFFTTHHLFSEYNIDKPEHTNLYSDKDH
jgi:hypothetical protein